MIAVFDTDIVIDVLIGCLAYQFYGPSPEEIALVEGARK